jgi:PAS domain S-box-containing protein
MIPRDDLPSIFQALVLQSPVSTWIADKDGTNIFENEASRRLFGIDREEDIVGKYNIFKDEQLAAQGVMPQIRKVFDEGGSTEIVVDYDSSKIQQIKVNQSVHKLLRGFLFAITDESNTVRYVVVQHEDYSAKYQAEKSLAESESRYKQLVEDVSDWVWAIDTEGRYTYSSPVVESILGYKIDEVIGKSTFDFIIPEDQEVSREVLDDAVRVQGPIVGLMSRNRRKDGSIRYLEASGKPVFDERGKLIGFRGIDRDVTERVLSEMQLRKNEERFRRHYEAISVGIFVQNTDGVFTYVNPKAAEIFNMSIPDLLASSYYDPPWQLVREDGSPFPNEERPTSRTLRTGKPTRGVIMGFKYPKSKSIRWVLVSAEPIVDPDSGGVQEVVSTLVDITERKRAQEALRRSEQNLRDLVANMPAAVFAYDRQGTILQVNSAFESWFGFSKDSVVGRSMFETVVSKEYKTSTEEVIDRVFRGETVENIEWEDVRADGTVMYILSSATPIFNEAGEVTMGLSLNVDITERKKAEHSRLELEEHKKDFYRRTILAATEGKFEVTERNEILHIAGPVIASWEIKEAHNVGEIRRAIADIAQSNGMDQSRIDDFILAFGEAATNAYKHAGGGVVSLHRVNNALMFVISDTGKGISALSLPEATMKKGYSTARSLGMGYKTILAVSDKVYLATGEGGTTVAVQMNLKPAATPQNLVDLIESWTM